MILAGFVFCLTEVVSLLAAGIFLRDSGNREVALSRESLGKGLACMQARAEAFGRMAAVQAESDAACRVLDDRNPLLADGLLANRLAAASRFDVMAFCDPQGAPVCVRAVTGEPPRAVPPPANLWQAWATCPVLLRPSSPTNAIQGYLVLDGEIWLCASRPVATDRNRGPVRGALVVAHRWDAEDDRELGLCGSARFRLRPAGPALAPAVPASRTRNGRPCSAALTDLSGAPAIILEAQAGRRVFTHGLTSLLYLNLWILVCGAVIALFALWLVDRWVLQSLARSLETLRTGLQTVAAAADPRLRVTENAHDAMGELANRINLMLAALEGAQREAIQSQKLAALGTLVAGMVHEVNNPNAVISLNADVMLRLLEGPAGHASPRDSAPEARAAAAGPLPPPAWTEEVRALAREIRDASRRIAALVTSLKNYARQADDRMTDDVKINEAIRDACALLRHRLKERQCVLGCELDEGLPTITGNAQQVTQVVMNLVQNASDAAARPGMRVTVRSRHDRDRHVVTVTVDDDGEGIAPEHLDRVFEPFFTTRQATGGTGLGLAISAAIVSAHGGTIRVASQRGQGTRFTLELPVGRAPHD